MLGPEAPRFRLRILQCGQQARLKVSSCSCYSQVASVLQTRNSGNCGDMYGNPQVWAWGLARQSAQVPTLKMHLCKIQLQRCIKAQVKTLKKHHSCYCCLLTSIQIKPDPAVTPTCGTVQFVVPSVDVRGVLPVEHGYKTTLCSRLICSGMPLKVLSCCTSTSTPYAVNRDCINVRYLRDCCCCCRRAERPASGMAASPVHQSRRHISCPAEEHMQAVAKGGTQQ